MDEDIDELKEKRMKEIKDQMEGQEAEEQKRKQMEQQKQALLKQILTAEARSRLSNLRMAKPKFTENVEMQLIQVAKTGKIDLPIDDDQLKKILKKLQNDNKSIDIKRK